MCVFADIAESFYVQKLLVWLSMCLQLKFHASYGIYVIILKSELGQFTNNTNTYISLCMRSVYDHVYVYLCILVCLRQTRGP